MAQVIGYDQPVNLALAMDGTSPLPQDATPTFFRFSSGAEWVLPGAMSWTDQKLR